MDEIREEIDRQLDRFQAVMLRLPDFCRRPPACAGAAGDSRRAARRARAAAFASECWLRDSGDSLHRIFLRGAQVKKALVVRGLAAGFRRAARRAGFVVNDGFAGFSEFNPGHDYAAQFESYLRARGRRI